MPSTTTRRCFDANNSIDHADPLAVVRSVAKVSATNMLLEDYRDQTKRIQQLSEIFQSLSSSSSSTQNRQGLSTAAVQLLGELWRWQLVESGEVTEAAKQCAGEVVSVLGQFYLVSENVSSRPEQYGFVPDLLSALSSQDSSLFVLLAPQLAVAARERLRDCQRDEWVPLVQLQVDLLSVPGLPRLLIDQQPIAWLPTAMSTSKLLMESFLGPLFLWINDTTEDESHRDRHMVKNILTPLLSLLLDGQHQDPLVADATLTFLATTIACLENHDGAPITLCSIELADSASVHISSSLVRLGLQVLDQSSHQIQTGYHEGYIPRRAFLHRPEPLRTESVVDERNRQADDDRRAREAETHHLQHFQPGQVYYPLASTHIHVLCDFCDKRNFDGVRYKCTVCDDSDICASCYFGFCQQGVVAEDMDPRADAEMAVPSSHCSAHLFVRLVVPIPALAVPFFEPLRLNPTDLLAHDARSESSNLRCAACSRSLDGLDLFFRCANCFDPRFVCPSCLDHEERHRHPSSAHAPGHLYLGIPWPWRQCFNPRAAALYHRGLMYPACVYPRERFTIETEIFYLAIKALHVGPIHALTKHGTLVEETVELQAFCACEQQRGEHEMSASSLSPHYAASQKRLAELKINRSYTESHLLDPLMVAEWVQFYARACRWLLELASLTENAFETVLTQFTRSFSAFPEHFFSDMCRVVHALTLVPAASTDPATLLNCISNPQVLAPLLVMLVQLIGSSTCAKNPHLRVEAAKALASLCGGFATNDSLMTRMRETLQSCRVLREEMVLALLQFHADMEIYLVRNGGLVFDSSASSGDQLLWGFVSLRTTTALLLRFLWRFEGQRECVTREFLSQAGGSHHVSQLLCGLWADATRLLEERNSKAASLAQLVSVRDALHSGRPIQLPFRASLLEGYLALHAKQLRLSMRLLVEVLELLTWLASQHVLKQAMLSPGLLDPFVRTVSFLISSVATTAQMTPSSWQHGGLQRVLANLMVLVAACGSPLGGDALMFRSLLPGLVDASGSSMLQFVGDRDALSRWQLISTTARMEWDSGLSCQQMENEATDDRATTTSSHFVSALAKDGRFHYDRFLDGWLQLVPQHHCSAGLTEEEAAAVTRLWRTEYAAVLRRCRDSAAVQVQMDQLFSDIPPAFLDPLLHTIMTDPVRLPSGAIVDRSVIERHLLSTEGMDPFTRQPLSSELLTPCEELRREILCYVRSKLQPLSTADRNAALLIMGGRLWK